MATYKAAFKNVVIVEGQVDRVTVEVLTKGSDSTTFIGADQTERVKLLRSSISIALLGVDFSSDQGGSYARDQVRNEIRFEKTSGPDKDLRDSIVNGWIEKVIKVNYPDLAPDLWPYALTDAEPTEDLAAWNTAMQAWAEKGFPISIQQIAEKNGGELADPADPKDHLGKPAAVAPGPQPPSPGANPFADLFTPRNQQGNAPQPGTLTAFAEDGSILEVTLTEAQRRALRVDS